MNLILIAKSFCNLHTSAIETDEVQFLLFKLEDRIAIVLFPTRKTMRTSTMGTFKDLLKIKIWLEVGEVTFVPYSYT